MNGVTKDIVFAYLSGQATVLQKKQVEEWLLQDGSAEAYCLYLEEWEGQHAQFSPDIDAAAGKFSAFLENHTIRHSTAPPPEKNEQVRPAKKFRMGRVWAAASIAGIVALGFVFRENLLYRHFRTGNAEIRTVELPDHSRVTLNANSDLKVARFFSWQAGRRAWLTGEALFDVQHTADSRTFTVAIPGNLEIQVLGTQFNVYARAGMPKIYLNRGSIRLESTRQAFKPFLMKPGQLLDMNAASTPKLSSNQSYTQASAWKDHVFVFDGTPLEEVARMLEEQFGGKVDIADTALGHRVISGSCKWNREEDILTTLSLMMKFSVYQASDTIYLK
jgi:transmembrane sensor